MPRKNKRNNNVDLTNEIVKKIKQIFLETVVRDWLNTPVKEWGNKSPIQMIKKGEGQKIIDAIKEADKDLKKERNDTGGETTIVEKTPREGDKESSRQLCDLI